MGVAVGQKGRQRLALPGGRGRNHHQEVLVQLHLRQWLQQADAADVLHGWGPGRAPLRWARVWRAAGGPSPARGLQLVVELNRGALTWLPDPVAARSDGGGAEPGGQGLQLGQAQPQRSLQPAAPPHFLRLMEGGDNHAGQLGGAIVAPPPSSQVEEYLDPGPAGVDLLPDDEGLHLPAEGEGQGRGRGCTAWLQQVWGEGLAERPGSVAHGNHGRLPGPLDQEGLGPLLQAGVPHQVLVGLLEEERRVSVEEAEGDGQVDGGGALHLDTAQN